MSEVKQILQNHPFTKQFLREFYEEHLEEMGFLLNQRQIYLHDPEILWPEVSETDERVLAHLDAMEAGGELALQCAREHLTDEDECLVLASAYVLCSIGNADTDLKIVIEGLSNANEDLISVWVHALKLAKSPLIARHTNVLLDAQRPEYRAAAAQILGYRREGDPPRFLGLVQDVDTRVQAAAALALGKLNYRQAVPDLEWFLFQDATPYPEAIVFALLLLGSRRTLDYCRRACQENEPPFPQLPYLLAMAGSIQDFSLLLHTCSIPKMTMHALTAMGILGNIAAVPTLIQYLETEDAVIKRLAASSLDLITGAGLRETVLVEEKEVEGAYEFEGEEEPTVLKIEQVSTKSDAWDRWWHGHKSKFNPTICWRRGKPFELGSCIAEMTDHTSLFLDRQRAGNEIVVRSGHHIAFEPDWFIHRQQQAIEQWNRWWAAKQSHYGEPESST